MLVFLDNGQADGELGAFTELALGLDFTLVQIDDLLDISQSETEALDVVLVAGVDTVELVEYLAQVLLLDALTSIANAKV